MARNRRKHRRPTTTGKKRDELGMVDTMAVLLVKDFATSGFPSTNIAQQVNLAYTYAEAMVERRKDRSNANMFKPVG